jgi:hypothetical protein
MAPKDPHNRLSKFLPSSPLTTVNNENNPKASDPILKEIIDLHKQYADEVWHSENLAIYSKSMYIDMANNFVRWIRGDFKPGAAGLKPRRRARLVPLA